MFFMFSFLISASCRWCNWKFACSYIADLSHCLREFSLVARSPSLSFSVPLADGGRAFIRLCGLITFALARESGIRGTTIWFYYETIIGMYSPYTECKRASRLLSAAFRASSFHRGASRERSSRSVTSLALRRSPSCKTRFAGYTTVARLSRRQGKEEGRVKKTKREGKEISLLFWE